MHDVLKLCDQLADASVEQLSMRTLGETLLHLLCAQGLRQSDILDSISHFRKGNWEKLWNTAIKNYKKWLKKRKDNPIQPKARTNKQKDKYAQKCALAGNYTKANQIICQEMLQACGDADTLNKLQRLHPAGNLNLDREFWPDADELRAFWVSDEGTAKLNKFLSVDSIRQWFRQRPALGAPDIDLSLIHI